MRGAKPPPRFDLGKKSTGELVSVLVSHENRWFRQTALRLLGDRKDQSALPRLIEILRNESGQQALEALWAIHQIGGLDESLSLEALDHANPHVRRWMVRLLGDRACPAPMPGSEPRAASAGAIPRKLAALAAGDPDAEVRSQLASTARRLPTEEGLPILCTLLARDEDADDPHLPLLLWWGIEVHLIRDRARTLALFDDELLWREPIVRDQILSRLVRRLAREGNRADFVACAMLFNRAPDSGARSGLTAGFERAYEGREIPPLPEELEQALGDARGGSIVLGIRRGHAESIARGIALLADAEAPRAERLRIARVFGEVTRPECVRALLDLVADRDDGLVQAALSSLGRYDDEQVARRVLAEIAKLSADARTAAVSLLASRASSAGALVAAVEAGTIPARWIDEDSARRMAWHPDSKLRAAVRRHWTAAGGPSRDELAADVERHLAALNEGTGDVYAGRSLFAASCGRCHQMFGEGGFIGPDLTGYQRDDLRGLVRHVVDPSAQIRVGFETQLVVTNDGRTVSGFLVDADEKAVTLRGIDGQNVTIRRDEIDELIVQRQLLMPERLLEEYTTQQVRDLFAYLRISQPLTRARR